MRQFTSNTRDAALRRVSHANRWLIAGSVALTGVLADVAANAFPGKTLHKGTSGSRSLHKSRAPSSSTTTTPGPVQPPSSPPESASQGGESQNGAAAGEGGSAQAPQASEAQPPQEAAPSGEAAQSQQQAPAQESEAPVVSGGS